jgi:hypothetical protein
MTFEFYRFRFHLRAIEAVHFPKGKSANVLRGTFGTLLRDMVPPLVYARLFEPGASLGRAPSGLSDWPRPFVFRAAHLDGLTVPTSGSFYFDVHVFDLREPALPYFRSVFDQLGRLGLGPGRGRAELERTEQLDLSGGGLTISDVPGPPLVINLAAAREGVSRVNVEFVTPTELKGRGELADEPVFPILFGRLRDRISTLRALYGAGPLEMDFRAAGERAKAISPVRFNLTRERVKRRSGRTGQVHPLGGFTGDVEYEGPLAEFVPWLEAGRWVGVGRQTVWGKGEIRVFVIPPGGRESDPTASHAAPE